MQEQKVLTIEQLKEFLLTAKPSAAINLDHITVMDNDDEFFGVCFSGSLVAQHQNGGEIKSTFNTDLIFDVKNKTPPYVMLSDIANYSSNGMSFILEDGSINQKPIDEIHELMGLEGIWDNFTPNEDEELNNKFLDEIKNSLNGNLTIEEIKSMSLV